MAVPTHPKRATLPLPGGREGAGVTVTPMRTAEILSPPRFYQRPSGPLATLRGLGLLTPRASGRGCRSRASWSSTRRGPFLIDTGLPPAAAHDVRAALGRRGAIAYKVRMEDGWAVTDRLVARGLDPLGIDLVVMTHMHYDHTGAVAQLPRSTFVVDAREWDAAVDGGFRHGYRRQLFDHGYEWRTLDFGAPRSTRSPPSGARSTSSATARCACSRRPGTRRAT